MEVSLGDMGIHLISQSISRKFRTLPTHSFANITVGISFGYEHVCL